MTGAGRDHNLFNPPERGAARDAVAALIVADDGRFLMQLRDDKPGIFYPGHYGLFGGAIEPGEDGEVALRRELVEELDFRPAELGYFNEMGFDFRVVGGERTVRIFYETRISAAQVDEMTLGEGSAMALLTAEEILLERRVVPYDSFAVWLYCARARLSPASSHTN